MNFACRAAFAGLYVAGLAIASAQSSNVVDRGAPSNSPGIEGSAPSPEDTAWRALDALRRQGTAGNDAAAALVAAADQYRDFFTKYPKNVRADDAKCLEGIMLLRARLVGDAEHATRRQAAIVSSRNNRLVTPSLRAELFAFADTVEIETGPALTRGDKLLAYERATRALIAEFPELEIGYESLCGIARDTSDSSRALALAKEIMEMSAAPSHVKTEARVIADRSALVGQSLPSMVRSVVAKDSPLLAAEGNPTFIYTWSRTDAPGILRAKAAAAKAAKGAVFIGVCLDSDRALAKATGDTLPGTQIYETAGANGPLAEKLKLTQPGLIYFGDAGGTIRSVSVPNYLDAPSLPFSG